jgi:hypothetical protein
MLPKAMKLASTVSNNPFISNLEDNANDVLEKIKTQSPKFSGKDQDDSDPEVATETGNGIATKAQGAIKSFAPGKVEIRMLPPAPGSAGKSKKSLESSDFNFRTMRSTVGKPISQFKAQLIMEAEDKEEDKELESLRPDMKSKTLASSTTFQPSQNFEDFILPVYEDKSKKKP